MHFLVSKQEAYGGGGKRKEKKRNKKKRKEEEQAKVWKLNLVWMLAFGMDLVIFIWNYMDLYGFLV